MTVYIRCTRHISCMNLYILIYSIYSDLYVDIHERGRFEIVTSTAKEIELLPLFSTILMLMSHDEIYFDAVKILQLCSYPPGN